MVRMFKCFASLLFFVLFTIPSLQAQSYRSDSTGKKETAEYYLEKGLLRYEKGDALSAIELLSKGCLLDVDKKYFDYTEQYIRNLYWKACSDFDNGDRQKALKIFEATIKYFPTLKVTADVANLLLDNYIIRLNKIKGTSDKSISTKTDDELSDLIVKVSSFKDAYSGRIIPQEVDQLLNDCQNQAPRIKEVCEKRATEEKRAEELRIKQEEQERLARKKFEQAWQAEIEAEEKRAEELRIKQEEQERLSREKQEKQLINTRGTNPAMSPDGTNRAPEGRSTTPQPAKNTRVGGDREKFLPGYI